VAVAVAVVALVGLVGLTVRLFFVGPNHRSGAVNDSFERADTERALGTSDSGQKWQAVHGVWGIEGHAARLVRFVGSKTSFALVDAGSPDGTVTVTESVVAPATGLVFRYRDPDDYWAIEAAPRYGTWSVRKIAGGKQVRAMNTGLSFPRDGNVITVRFSGSAVDVFIDGVRRRTLVDTDFTDATKSGLTATGAGAVAARWASFRVSTTVDARTAPTTSRRQ